MASPRLKIVVGADISRAEKELKKLSSRLKGIGKNLSSFGFSMTKMTAPLIAWGGSALAASLKIQECFKTIRAGTGATGDALKGLVDDFRAVGAKTSMPLESVAVAVADLNTRLGLSGLPLQEMVLNVAEAARMAGEDVKGLANEAAKAMNDAGIAAGEGAAFMDKLFLASQNTGIGMSELANKMYKFGTPLRAMGFGLEETIAMLSSFDRVGVNTDLVMGSLRIALGKMAKAGETDVPGALRKSILAIKNAGNAGTATMLAIEAFGQKAGPDMAGAIREGRFEVDALVETLMKSKGAIKENAAATDGFVENWKKVKDQITFSLQPLGDAIISLSKKYILPLAESVSKLSPEFSEWTVIIGAGVAALGPLTWGLGTLTTVVVGGYAAIGGFLLGLKRLAFVTLATKGAITTLTADLAANGVAMSATSVAARTTAASMVAASSTAGKLRLAMTGLGSALSGPAGIIVLLGSVASLLGYLYFKQAEKAREKTECVAEAVADLETQIKGFSADQLGDALKKQIAVIDELNDKLGTADKKLKSFTLPTAGMAVGGIGQLIAERNRIQDAVDLERAKKSIIKALHSATPVSEKLAAKKTETNSNPQSSVKNTGPSAIALRIGVIQDEIKYLGADPASYLAELEGMYNRIPAALSDDKKKIMDMQNEIIDAVSGQQDAASEKLRDQKERIFKSLSFENSMGLMSNGDYAAALLADFNSMKALLADDSVANWTDDMRDRFRELQSVMSSAAGESLESLKKQFENCKISGAEYESALAAIAEKYKEYPLVVKEAEAALASFNETQASKLPTVASQVNQSVDDLKMKLAEMPNEIGNAFSRAIVSGESLGDVLMSLLQDIGQVIMKALFMQTLFGGSGGGDLLSGLFPNAKGNVYGAGGVIPFAHGGIVTRPTLFPFARGTGLMGEAGPEAILPLERMAGGKLGVNASGEGEGGTVIHMTVNAVDAPSFVQMLRTNRTTIESLIVDNISRNSTVRRAIQAGV